MIRVEIKKLVPAAIQALPAHVAALKEHSPAEEFSAAAADQYERLLDDLLAAMRTARCDTADGVVWVRFDWAAPGFLVSAATAIESSPAQQADWLAAARAVDEGNHRGLLKGLLGYVKAQNPPRFPEGGQRGEDVEAGNALELDRRTLALSRPCGLACRVRLRLEQRP